MLPGTIYIPRYGCVPGVPGTWCWYQVLVVILPMYTGSIIRRYSTSSGEGSGGGGKCLSASTFCFTERYNYRYAYRNVCSPGFQYYFRYPILQR